MKANGFINFGDYVVRGLLFSVGITTSKNKRFLYDSNITKRLSCLYTVQFKFMLVRQYENKLGPISNGDHIR